MEIVPGFSPGPTLAAGSLSSFLSPVFLFLPFAFRFSGKPAVTPSRKVVITAQPEWSSTPQKTDLRT
jgi:hypothetical protein